MRIMHKCIEIYGNLYFSSVTTFSLIQPVMAIKQKYWNMYWPQGMFELRHGSARMRRGHDSDFF